MKKVILLLLLSVSAIAQRTIEQKRIENLADSLAKKVDKIAGKGLSSNDFSNAEREKLGGIIVNSDITTTPSEALLVITGWGDSMISGANAQTPFTMPLNSLSGYTIDNQGVGGETSTQIKTRMLATTSKYSNSVIIWAGRNNTNSKATVLADIASMVSALGHNRYIVISICNGTGEIIGTTQYNDIMAINADLSTIYGERYLNLHSWLLTQGTGAGQDAIDAASGVIPFSLRTDAIHMTTATNALIANKIYVDKIKILLGDKDTYITTRNYKQNLNYDFKNPISFGSTTPNLGYFSRLGINTTASSAFRIDIDNNSLTSQTIEKVRNIPQNNTTKLFDFEGVTTTQGVEVTLSGSSLEKFNFVNKSGTAALTIDNQSNYIQVPYLVTNSGSTSIFNGAVKANQNIDISIGTYQGNGALKFGANVASNTRTANTRKIGNIVSAPYVDGISTSNTDVATISIDNDGTNNIIGIGGFANLRAATKIQFFAASNITTNGGTNIATFDINGLVIGGTTKSVTSILDLQSTDKGALLPRMTTVQKNAILSPATGLLVFDTDLNKLNIFLGTWRNIALE